MEILYSDNDIAVCIKSVGLDSETQVPEALKEQLGGEYCTVHRLDKNVGGVMVYARNPATAAALSRAIQEGTMVKEYVVWSTAHLRKAGIGQTSCGKTAQKTRCLW